jgi:spore maturation protein CgeB
VKILFVATLHHPEVLAAARRAAPPGDEPLFPSSQAHHFWVSALRRLGHTCAVFWRSDSTVPGLRTRALRMTRRLTLRRALPALLARVPAWNPDVRLRNRRLLRAARSFRPDVVVLTGDNDVVLPATLASIRRELGASLVYASGTSPIVFARAIERAAAPLYDLVVTGDHYHAVQWLELGAGRAEVLPLAAADPSFHRPYELTEAERARHRCQVGFVGTLVPPSLYGDRIAALEALRDLDLGIWSVHEVPGSLRPAFRGAALGEEMLRVLGAATIAVNPHANFTRYGGNMRLFELCGIGAFQVTDDRPGVHRWFTAGEHLVTYRDPADLRRLVGHYLARDEERRRIAAAGQRHVHAHHTYDQRMERLTTLIAEVRPS